MQTHHKTQLLELKTSTIMVDNGDDNNDGNDDETHHPDDDGDVIMMITIKVITIQNKKKFAVVLISLLICHLNSKRDFIIIGAIANVSSYIELSLRSLYLLGLSHSRTLIW